MYFVNINGHEFGTQYSIYDDIWLADIPVITPSETKRTISDIYMYNGGMAEKNFYKGTAKLTLKFHSTNFDRMLDYIPNALIDEALQVTNSYDDDSFYWSRVTVWKTGQRQYEDGYTYRILNARMTEIKSFDDNYGRITIEYDIEPFRYFGDFEYNIVINGGQTKTLPKTGIGYPLYHVVATGAGTITVGSSGGVAILGACTIDINTKTKTTKSNGILADNYVSGNYEELWVYGRDDITASSNLTVTVYPRQGVSL